MKVSFSSDNYKRSNTTEIKIGPEIDLKMQILPFVLFGATSSNTGLDLNFEKVLHMTEAMKQEAAAGWPASHTSIVNHPIGQFISSFIVMRPEAGTPGKTAYIVRSSNEVSTGKLVSMVNDITYKLHESSGDMSLSRVTYSPVIALDNTITKTNKLAWIGNGVGSLGNGVGTGAITFGFLLHETGHAMGLNHAGPEYREPTGRAFPYINGSLDGSAWGFNSFKNEFRHNLIPKTASIYKSCTTKAAYPKNAEGRCYRLDPMEDGDYGSDPTYSFSLFSDFNTGRIQKWITSKPKLDPKSETSFSKWDSASSNWQTHTPSTSDYGLNAIKGNLPVIRNVPLVRIVLTYSMAGTPDVSRFYTPIHLVDNSIETIDPTDESQLAKIYPYSMNRTNPEYKHYCHRSGCDYTLRVTFSDGTQSYRVLKDGFRKWSDPSTYDTGVNDATNPKSLRIWAISVPRPKDAQVKKLELLDTPKIWTFTVDQIRKASVIMSEDF